MESNKRNHHNHVEINDLIDDAVNNALARRQEGLSALSNEEAKNIAGGTTVPVVTGVVIDPLPPVVHGVIIHGIVLGVVIKPTV